MDDIKIFYVLKNKQNGDVENKSFWLTEIERDFQSLIDLDKYSVISRNDKIEHIVKSKKCLTFEDLING